MLTHGLPSGPRTIPFFFVGAVPVEGTVLEVSFSSVSAAMIFAINLYKEARSEEAVV